MKTSILPLLLLSSGAMAEAPQTIPALSIQEIQQQSGLYNEENGYWADRKQINAEMLRDLLRMSTTEWNSLKARNESNGYW